MSEKTVKPQPGKKPREQSIITKTYLLAYNFGQVLGWSYMLYQLLNYYLTDLRKTTALWDYIGATVVIFQNAAVLEIVHAATGIVPSNVVLTTFQVFSRVMLVCGVLLATPNAIFSPGLPLALFAWSVTEIIRYGFYGFNLLNIVPGFLTFLRYTTFIVLYPTGVTGELWCLYWAQSYAQKHKIWSIEVPNTSNFTFSYLYFLWIVMLLYIPLFPQLYLHMFALRKKVLGPKVKSK
ncbi:very-long-chain (3R)-3-hydroxyacyl-CoA dehydratase hpo-8 [Sitodiplosis mosellana]|uniref:very-long-chain (3R)-3-hydroxyacyl-CoA dehydratase hpo-8 n=1 Tax=Sitodiplosis mosellana TaxID=263140 RepID=UPI00244510DB|nr:very-long-chain (3R)-3-hydroxyacyl-CoA dehydratase hpo-8 [Sitodiplosis mosellana]